MFNKLLSKKMISGSGYMDLSPENKSKIIDIVKLSRSNRFGFSSLELTLKKLTQK